SFKSFQDNTVRVEYTPGQPRGVVAGQSGNTPHRIDISRKEGTDSSQYFPGTLSSRFILYKNKGNNGYSETRIHDADSPSDDGGQRLSDETVSALRKRVTELEDLLLCPVDVEFAIDHQGRLFLLQVRPVTRLSGGMDFAMFIPEETLAIGEGISEGYCTGSIWLAKNREAGSMPEGAIVLAHHVEEWMLEPEFLRWAGGFVLAEAGFNDHAAILMRQEEKTLMLAGEQFAALATQDGQQATLACARFNGKPGAFIVAGDLTGKLVRHISLSSAVSDVPLAKALPSRDDLSPPEATFHHVASGFQWLTDQNARLLALFGPGGGLDCLANPIKLSMSSQRSKLLAGIEDSVNLLIYGAQAMLEGYLAFLRLASRRRSPQVKLFRRELPVLNNRLEMLKETVRSGLESIILPMQTAEKGLIFQGAFCQWVTACHQLQSSLQALHFREAEQVRSVHDLIFALHKRFVEALAPVTLASGQGQFFQEKKITYVDCTTPGAKGEKASLLTPSGKACMQALELSGTVVSMDDALMVNLELGNHVGLVELLEQAEGGKERTLRLKFSDQFDQPYGIHKDGKSKRMWFLVQLLKAIELDENADSMKVRCNAAAGQIIVECSRMKSSPHMQDAFEKLMIVLETICDLDIFFENADIFEESHWDFNLLEQRLNPDVVTDADRFTFQHCLFSMFYLRDYRISPACCQLLSSHLQQFVFYAERLGECRSSVYFREKPEVSLREMLMSEEMNESIRKELLHHFLLADPNYSIPPFEDFYLHLKGQYFIIKPSRDYTLTFDIPPAQSFSDIKEKVRKALVKDGLNYVSQQVRNDKELVLEAIAAHPIDLKYVGQELKGDKDVIIAAVTRRSRSMQDVSPEIPDYDEVVTAVIAKRPKALKYASERIRGDKNIIKSLMNHSIVYLGYASKTLFNDREYMLDLIEHNARAFEFSSPRLKNNEAFVDSAILRNYAVCQYLM
ncbi:DUF4116 domain-containing protein, partial [Endozoicomonas sp. ONNA1]|uniref:DUF4116 domain-containing protein n=1 Tax=Endozoicomonas sp. ONNA1 TaxID=2828740 RepID=UPI0021477244